MRKREIFWLSFIAVFFLFALAANAEVNAGSPATDQKGCYFLYSSTSGKLHPQPFIKTGDKEYGDENGNPEIWGFFILNLPEPDENGKIMPVNVRADMFVPADGKLHEIPTGTTSRKVKCTVWTPSETQQADAR